MSNIWRVAVDPWGSALPSAAKTNNYPQVRNKNEKSREESLRIFCKPIDSMLCQSIESMGLQKIPIVSPRCLSVGQVIAWMWSIGF